LVTYVYVVISQLCRGYIPPEFIEQQIISYKYDIFSLGVIIKKMVESDIGDIADKEFIEHVRLLLPPSIKECTSSFLEVKLF
jgi:serine/threonine protein kinase